MAAIGNIDKVIDDFNENQLEDKINYFRVLDGSEDKIPEVETTTASTDDNTYTVNMDSGNITVSSDKLNTSVTYYGNNISYCLKENDSVRRIKFKANSLLEQLNLPLLEEDKDIELKCLIVGRDCDKYGYSINEDYE